MAPPLKGEWVKGPGGKSVFRSEDGRLFERGTDGKPILVRSSAPNEALPKPPSPNRMRSTARHDTKSSTVSQTHLPVRKYNRRMAKRMAKRAHINEQGVAVCFAYNNLLTTLLIGLVEDVVRFVPIIGRPIELAISIGTFYFHRIVLVTDRNVYVFRDWPFHFPGKRLAAYPRRKGVVRLGSPKPGAFSRFVRRGQLTFKHGHVVYHGILWIRRARYIAQEANRPISR